ncbi:hypothetical protein D3C80_1563070 [compost metagenome]
MAVLIPLATDIQNDPPALAPVAVDAVNHHGLIAGDGFGPGGAYSTVKRLCGLLAMVRLIECSERRADQLQNNSGNCQSHEQFNQAETSLMHDVLLPGVLWLTRSLRERRPNVLAR